VLLAAAILLAAVVLMLAKRWRSRPEAVESPHDHLAQFRKMYEQGELTQEEYNRVHALLTQRIRQQTPPAAGEASPESSPPGSAPEGSSGPAQKPEASPSAPQPEPPSGDAAT
jgi:hypothetical protein